jgi:hypothetical protein
MRASLLILHAAACLLLSGCSDPNRFDVAETRGRIVCEGQPVPHARVFFEPLQTSESAIVGKQAFAVAGADGTFVLSTYEENDGAVVGKHRVRVDRPHPEDHPKFTCPCVLNSEIDVMEVEVKPDTVNEFEVVLAKKTGREKPLLDDDD